MHFAHVIQSRKGRACAVLIALAIIGILIARHSFCCLADHKDRLIWTNSTAYWIEQLLEAGTDQAP
jgi:hypothetical protein